MDLEMKDNKRPEQDPADQPGAGSPQGGGTLSVEESCRRLTQYLEDTLTDVSHARLETEGLAEPCRELGEALRSFHALAEELVDTPPSCPRAAWIRSSPPATAACTGG